MGPHFRRVTVARGGDCGCMGDARGCRGGRRRGLRPRCRSLCCRLMASALFGMRAAPSRRNGGARPHRLLPLNRARRPRFADGGVRWGKSLRARCGVPLRPLCPLAAVVRGQRRGRRQSSAALVQFAQRWGVCSRRPRRRPRACAGNQAGGLLQRLLPPRRCGGAPPPLQPRPRFWPRGGAILVSLRRVWGLRRLRAALKGLPSCTRCAMKCGVHGFAMNPRFVTSCSRAFTTVRRE